MPGKVLRRKCLGGLGAKINQLIKRHLCEITRGPPPLILSGKRQIRKKERNIFDCPVRKGFKKNYSVDEDILIDGISDSV